MAGLDRWLFHAFPMPARDLAVYRILFAASCLLTAVPRGLWLRNAPQAFFSPPAGIAALFPGFPPPAVLVALNVALVIALSALLVGWHTRTASIVAAVTLLLINTWMYALGKINHDILRVVIVAVLACSAWGRHFSYDARRRGEPPDDEPGESWPVAIVALIIGVGMFTAGYGKLVTGWLDPGSHATYGYVVNNFFVTGRPTWLGGLFLQVRSALLLESADWATVLLELGFLAAVVSRGTMRFVCAIACWFHIGVGMMFDIVLFEVNVVAYGVLVGYTRLPMPMTWKDALVTLGRSAGRLPAGLLIVLIAAAATALRSLTGFESAVFSRVILLVGGMAGLGYFAATARCRLAPNPRVG